MTKRMQNDLSLNEYLNSIDRAIEYTYNSGIYIIYPTETIESLETLWSQFMSQPKSVRKRSDVESYRIFGMDNFDHYMALRDEYEVQSRTNPYLREYIEESSMDIMDIKAKEEKIYNHVRMVMDKRKKESINESVILCIQAFIEDSPNFSTIGIRRCMHKIGHPLNKTIAVIVSDNYSIFSVFVDEIQRIQEQTNVLA